MDTIEMAVAVMAKIPAVQTVMGGSLSEGVLKGDSTSSACAVTLLVGCIFSGVCLRDRVRENGNLVFLDAKKLKNCVDLQF